MLPGRCDGGKRLAYLRNSSAAMTGLVSLPWQSVDGVGDRRRLAIDDGIDGTVETAREAYEVSMFEGIDA